MSNSQGTSETSANREVTRQRSSEPQCDAVPIITDPIPGPYNPPSDLSRLVDTIDSFAEYAHWEECNISSLSLHTPINPLCTDKTSLLRAVSGGGRPGYDKPYIPLDCDMRWYTTAEVCSIFSRYSHVLFIGDSLMRHIVESMYVFLRADIGLGAIADWAVEPEPKSGIDSVKDCLCDVQTGKRACSDAVIEDSEWLLGNSSTEGISPLACPGGANGGPGLKLSYLQSPAYPISDEDLERIKDAATWSSAGGSAQDKSVAAVLHTTFWNNVNVTATRLWIDDINSALASALGDRVPPTLFVTANAGGLTKSARYIESQGNQALANFERDLHPQLDERGVDMLGCYNMSLQATSSDGTHANFEGNLLKAMTILNWLDWSAKG